MTYGHASTSRRSKSVLFASLTVVFTTATATARDFIQPENADIQLGDGFISVAGELAAKPSCLKSVEPRSNPAGGQDVRYELTRIEANEQVASVLGINSGFKFSTGLWNFSASADFLSMRRKDSHVVSFILKLHVGNKVESLQAEDIQARYKAMNDLEFRKRCGDTFVRSVTRGGDFSVIFYRRFDSESEALAFQANFKAESAKGDAAKLAMQKRLEHLSSNDMTNISLWKVGGTGPLPEMDPASLAAYAASFPDLVNPTAGGSESQFAFTVGRYSGRTAPTPSEQLLADLGEDLDEIASRGDLVRDVLNHADAYSFEQPFGSEMTRLRKWVSDLDDMYESVYNAGRACSFSSEPQTGEVAKCKRPALRIPSEGELGLPSKGFGCRRWDNAGKYCIECVFAGGKPQWPLNQWDSVQCKHMKPDSLVEMRSHWNFGSATQADPNLLQVGFKIAIDKPQSCGQCEVNRTDLRHYEDIELFGTGTVDSRGILTVSFVPVHCLDASPTNPCFLVARSSDITMKAIGNEVEPVETAPSVETPPPIVPDKKPAEGPGANTPASRKAGCAVGMVDVWALLGLIALGRFRRRTRI